MFTLHLVLGLAQSGKHMERKRNWRKNLAKKYVYIEVCGLLLLLTAKSPPVPVWNNSTNKTMKSCRRVLITGVFMLYFKTKYNRQLRSSFHFEITSLGLQRIDFPVNHDNSQQV